MPKGEHGAAARQRRSHVLRLLPICALGGVLVACSGGHHPTGTHVASGRLSSRPPSRYGYNPPGPPSDPWGPYIREASAKYDVPQRWIREVMHQESGGKLYHGGGLVTSGAGAMGLMQVMPETFAELSARYDLGNDPYEPHDNIMAGTAYIKELYNQYGSPGFLAAYNAGPGRLNHYLSSGYPLPGETLNYLASIAPRLGNDIAPSGPLAGYQLAGSAPAYASATVSAPRVSGSSADRLNALMASSQPLPPPSSASMTTVAAVAPVAAPLASDAGASADDLNRLVASSQPLPAPAPQAEPVYSAPAYAAPAAPMASDADASAEDLNRLSATSRPLPRPAPQVAAPAATAARPRSSDQDFDTLLAETAAAKPVVPTAKPVRYAAAVPSAPPSLEEATLHPQAYSRQVAALRPASLPRSKPGAAPGYLAAPEAVSAAHSTGYLVPPALPVRPASTAAAHGQWGVQVGAFASAAQARAVADNARSLAHGLLDVAQTNVDVTRRDGHVFYRARLVSISADAASGACGRLNHAQITCIVVPPGKAG